MAIERSAEANRNRICEGSLLEAPRRRKGSVPECFAGNAFAPQGAGAAIRLSWQGGRLKRRREDPELGVGTFVANRSSTMTIVAADITRTDPYTVAPTTRLDELELELTRRRMSSAPVLEAGQLVGIVTRADVLRQLGLERALADVAVDYYRQLEGLIKGLGPSATGLEHADSQLGSRLRALKVQDAMSREPVSVDSETPLVEVARLMVDRRIHCVLVTKGKRLRGLISSLDVLEVVAQGKV